MPTQRPRPPRNMITPRRWQLPASSLGKCPPEFACRLRFQPGCGFPLQQALLCEQTANQRAQTASRDTSVWCGRNVRFSRTLTFEVISAETASRAITIFFSAAARASVNRNSNQTGTNKIAAAAIVHLRESRATPASPDKEQERRWFHQTSAKIVENLPLRNQ